MSSNPVASVFLVEDEAMVRAGLRALVERELGMKVVGEGDDARVAIREIETLRPDVVFLDLTRPGMLGLDVIGEIKNVSPRTKVLIASSHDSSHFLQQARRAGADGYLSKNSDAEELRLAIESVMRGESYVSPKAAHAVVGDESRTFDSPLDSLTNREREVFQLVALGKANKESAALLHISLSTVKKHRESLQRKLDCHSAAGLARLAIREGLLAP